MRIRLITDLDHNGHAIGGSVEAWVDGERQWLTVLPPSGPFDTEEDVRQQLHKALEQRMRIQGQVLRLPLP